MGPTLSRPTESLLGNCVRGIAAETNTNQCRRSGTNISGRTTMDSRDYRCCLDLRSTNMGEQKWRRTRENSSRTGATRTMKACIPNSGYLRYERNIAGSGTTTAAHDDIRRVDDEADTIFTALDTCRSTVRESTTKSRTKPKTDRNAGYSLLLPNTPTSTTRTRQHN